jgi:hypothetical protein
MTPNPKTTLTTALAQRCYNEKIDITKVCAIAPRWAESAPRSPGARSALVHCDLILRSDGSAVYLDGCMGWNSLALCDKFLQGKVPGQVLVPPATWEEWDRFVESITDLPASEA